MYTVPFLLWTYQWRAAHPRDFSQDVDISTAVRAYPCTVVNLAGLTDVATTRRVPSASYAVQRDHARFGLAAV